MKRNYLIPALLVCLMMLFSQALSAQNPPPPPEDPAGGGNNLPVGGGAPVGSGLAILVAMGLGYGFKKYQDVKRII